MTMSDFRDDARDARFYRYFHQGEDKGDIEAAKKIWDEAWNQALAWFKAQQGR